MYNVPVRLIPGNSPKIIDMNIEKLMSIGFSRSEARKEACRNAGISPKSMRKHRTEYKKDED